MPINPGRLRHRITIQAAERVITPGGWEDQWIDKATVWAAVTTISVSGAARYTQAGFSTVTHEVLLRAGPHLDLSNTRIKWGSMFLQPVAPPRDTENRGRLITIACEEVADTSTPTSNGDGEGESSGEE